MKNDQLTRGKLLRIGGLLLALMTIIAGVGYLGMGKIDDSAIEIAEAEDAVTQALLADMAHDATRSAPSRARSVPRSTEDTADDEAVRADVADNGNRRSSTELEQGRRLRSERRGDPWRSTQRSPRPRSTPHTAERSVEADAHRRRGRAGGVRRVPGRLRRAG